MALPRTAVVELDGHTIYVLHIIDELDRRPAPAGISAVIYGALASGRRSTIATACSISIPGAPVRDGFGYRSRVARMSVVDGRLTRTHC